MTRRFVVIVRDSNLVRERAFETREQAEQAAAEEREMFPGSDVQVVERDA